MQRPLFGLIGTISRDEIICADGRRLDQLGGILYQAAALCALDERTIVFANLAEGLAAEVKPLLAGWPTLRRAGLVPVPGPGNRVRLVYPERGERREVLESAVPPLDPDRIVRKLRRLDFLVMVVNSGFDLSPGSWRAVVESAACPVWFDIHSLTLVPALGVERPYRPIPDWRDWVRGATYLQANRQEIACMLGRPDAEPSPAEIGDLCREALDLGLEAVFITLGKEGGLVATRGGMPRIGIRDDRTVVDTTGCGDVFAAAAASRLARGEDPVTAAAFGLELASRAAYAAGVRATYELVRRLRPAG
jgi:hypothetical protein